MTKQLKAYLEKLLLIKAMFSVPVSSLTIISQHLFLQHPSTLQDNNRNKPNNWFLGI